MQTKKIRFQSVFFQSFPITKFFIQAKRRGDQFFYGAQWLDLKPRLQLLEVPGSFLLVPVYSTDSALFPRRYHGIISKRYPSIYRSGMPKMLVVALGLINVFDLA